MLLNKSLWKSITAVLLGIALVSCTPKRKMTPGGSTFTPRNMLHDDHILDLNETYNGSLSVNQLFDLPFSLSYIDIAVSAKEKRSFIHVSIPDSTGDQEAAKLVDSYWGFTKFLVTQWAAVNTGIAIDLCSNGEGKTSADFLITAGKNTFPLMIVWDNAAAERVKRYFSWLEIIPGVAATESPLLKGAYFQQLNNIESLQNGRTFSMQSFELLPYRGCFQ